MRTRPKRGGWAHGDKHVSVMVVTIADWSPAGVLDGYKGRGRLTSDTDLGGVSLLGDGREQAQRGGEA